MGMVCSELASAVMLSPNSAPRTAKVDRITIHHMAAVSSAEACAASFLPTSRNASANYCIGNDGDLILSVEESRRSFCSSNRENDDRAITIEVSNSERNGDWPVSDAAYATLLDLCEDICRRHGIEELRYTGDTTGNMTLHKWFASTACPGPYLESRMQDIAAEVNRRLNSPVPDEPDGDIIYRVQVGAFRNRSFAEALRDELREAGYADAFIAEQEWGGRYE
jgi:hypothetical protein